MKIDAKPIKYVSCYLGEAFPPKNGQRTQIEKIGDSFLADDPCIVLEIRDTESGILEGIRTGLAKDKSVKGLSQMIDDHPELGLLRGFLNLTDARQLCCHLVTYLADTDDRVARAMHETMNQKIQELNELEGELPEIE